MRRVHARGSHGTSVVREGLELHRFGRIDLFTEAQQVERCVRANLVIHTYNIVQQME